MLCAPAGEAATILGVLKVTPLSLDCANMTPFVAVHACRALSRVGRRARANKFARSFALRQPGRNGGCTALWLRSRRRHCRPSGAHSRSHRPPLKYADAVAYRANGPAGRGAEAAGLLRARRQLSSLHKLI